MARTSSSRDVTKDAIEHRLDGLFGQEPEDYLSHTLDEDLHGAGGRA
jgi:hypothetical protein